MDIRSIYTSFNKQAASILTPEAEQAAMQPPVDPAMAGGMPPAQGMPQAAADPAAQQMAAGGAQVTGPNGGQIPPEILQDQQFIQFLAQTLGIQLDAASGTFIGPDGQPIPAGLIVQAYQEYQTQMMQQQQMAAGGAMPMDPSMMGSAPGAPEVGGAPGGQQADPAMMEGAPMDPAAMNGMPPEAGVPADQAIAQEQAGGAPIDMVNEIAGAVMSAVESVLQDMTAAQEKRISAILEKLDALQTEVSSLRDTTDKRTKMEQDAEKQLRDDLSADLNPEVKQAAAQPVPKPIVMPTQKKAAVGNLFGIISGISK